VSPRRGVRAALSPPPRPVRKPSAVGSDVDVCDCDSSFGRRRIAGDRRQAAVGSYRPERGRRATAGCVHCGRGPTSAWSCVSHAGRPVGIVIVEDDVRAVAADARLARGARRRDDGRPSRGRELHDDSAGHAAGAVHENPVAGKGRCRLAERLIGRQRGNGQPGRRLPRNGGRLPRDQCGRSDDQLRPRALVPQRHRMSEDLVTRCEARHVVARCDDDPRRLDAKRQRWSPADLPVADPDDLVPVADLPRAPRSRPRPAQEFPAPAARARARRRRTRRCRRLASDA
jgi:hypothetical protein